MDKTQKVLTATAFAALLSGGVVSQAFAHVAHASPDKKDSDPFHNPDFSLQKAMNFFDAIEQVTLDHHLNPTPDSLSDIIAHAPLTAEQQDFIHDLQVDTFGGKYQPHEEISAEDIQEFNDRVQVYLGFYAQGFENIQSDIGMYNPGPGKAPVIKLEEYPTAHVGFKLNHGEICGPPYDVSTSNSTIRVQELKNKLDPIPHARHMFKTLEEKGTGIEFKSLADQEAAGTYSGYTLNRTGTIVNSGKVRLEETLQSVLYADVFFHEARHAEQAHFGDHFHQVKDLRVSLVDLIWLDRVIEADAEAETVYQQFIIMLAGDPTCFKMNKNSAPFSKMFDAAWDQYQKDPTSLQDGRLKRAAFDAWFKIPHIKDEFYDKRMLKSRWLTDHNLGMAARKVEKSQLPLEVVESIGVAGGENINYLKLKGYPSLDDPYYKDNYSPENQEALDHWMKSKWLDNPVVKNATRDDYSRSPFPKPPKAA